MPCKSLITDWGKSISDTLVSCHRISLRRISLRDARSSPAARPSGGERKYDDLEKRLAALPVVTVPAITMEGDANGAIHAPSTAYRNKFSGKYDYRLITGGVGHNIPQEAPQAFAQAVIDVDRL